MSGSIGAFGCGAVAFILAMTFAAGEAEAQIQPIGACCLPDGTCAVIGKTSCLNQCGVFTGGISCGGTLCPIEIPRACCLPDGTCADTTTCLCAQQGGVAQGVLSSCATTTCDPVGMCCVEGACTDNLTVAECDNLCGMWIDNTCDALACPLLVGGACCLDGACSIQSQSYCECQGGLYQGDFTDCTGVSCDLGACCLPDGSCEVTTKLDCGDRCGFFRGIGTDCMTLPLLCPIEIPGACCLPDGTCIETTTCLCEQQGGIAQGAFESCATAVCDPVGMCCVEGACTDNLTVAECDTLCGMWLGSDYSCDTLACPLLVGGACCLDGACSIQSQDYCECKGGTYQGDFTDCATAGCDLGACCLDGRCRIMTQTDCENRCGRFQGVGSECSPFALCPIEIPRACCLPDGTCSDTTSCLCAQQGGEIQGPFSRCATTTCSTCPNPTLCPLPVPGSPADIGSWQLLPYNSGVFVVHAALLPTGKVLMFSGTAEIGLPLESRVWDPTTGTMTTQFFTDDLFCANHAMMPDGRVLVNGGASSPGQGIKSTWIFDSGPETWTQVADMAYARWYPTTATLPNGKMITFSGRATGSPITQMEVFDPGTMTWSTLPPSADKSVLIYPSMHVMSDGNLLYTGTAWSGGTSWPSPPASALLDLGTNTWSNVANHIVPNRIEGFSVLLPGLSKVMVVGGECNGPGTQTKAEIIDMSVPTPAWQSIADTSFARKNVGGAILPNGNVLLCTGIDGYKWFPNSYTLDAEIFNSATQTWKTVAAMTQGRQYHSVVLLLPDGRVLTTGSVSAAGNNMTMEVYSPPYLFQGPRPTITAAPASATYGATFSVSTPDACDINEVALVRLSSITHHTNTDQRFLSLGYSMTGTGSLSVTAPANANLAPPGYYMLFLLNDCGVPSVASMVQIQ